MKINSKGMESRTINLYELTEGNLVFPLFQRGYVWPANRAKSLYESLLNAAKDNVPLKKYDKNDYYLMSIYHYEYKTRPCITDGQQRLITMFVLFRCINDYIQEKNITNIKPLDEFRIEYECNDYQAKWRKFSEQKKYSTPKYVVAYKVAKEFVAENAEHIKLLRDFLEYNIRVTLIDCGDPDKGYEIFTMINSGSEPMKKEDIIMTAIKQTAQEYGIKLNKNASKKDIVELIEDYCVLTAKAYESDKLDNFAIMSFMNREIVSSKEKFARFTEFLDAVTNSKNQTFYKILYYSQRPNLRHMFATLILKDINVLSGEKLDAYVTKMFEPMLILNLVWKMNGVKGTRPAMLFKQIREAINDEKTPDDILNIICAHINDNTKDCKINVKDAIDLLADGQTFSSTNVFKSFLLYEPYRLNKSAYIDVSRVDLEHIYPKDAVGDWAANGYPTNDTAKKKLCNRFGNYMLLPGSLNKKIKNKFITNKKSEYEKIINSNKILEASRINRVDFSKFLRGETAEEYMKEREKEFIYHLKENYLCGNLIFID